MKSKSPLSPRLAAEFRQAILGWYRQHRRDLPWRRTRDPYAIWVSETMLQQTQVATVIPYYLRFIERFPTLQSLAAAEIDDVLPYWSGLGYYRRIRNLHAAVRRLVLENDGQIPQDREKLLALPGVGRYTAGALLSIAFNHPEPIVDGNVARVLSRIFEIADAKETVRLARLWRLSQELVPAEGAADFNQALMELGSMICLPKEPQCLLCPVRTHCQARRHGTEDRIPIKEKAARTVKQNLALLLVERQKRLLLVQRKHATVMDGLWEIPSAELAEQDPLDPSRVLELFRSRYDLPLSRILYLGCADHAITYRRIKAYVYRASVGASSKASIPGRCWILPKEISNYGVSSLSLKALQLAKSNLSVSAPRR